MGEILTNFGENGQHLPSNTPWDRGEARPNEWVRLRRREELVIYGAT